jgi:hypothetical protein
VLIWITATASTFSFQKAECIFAAVDAKWSVEHEQLQKELHRLTDMTTVHCLLIFSKDLMTSTSRF